MRAAMLEEAVSVIRELWTGGLTTHHGAHFTVENARIYTLPSTLPPIHVAGSGERMAALAGRGNATQELARPKDFEELTRMVDEDDVAAVIPCGPEAQPILDSVAQYVDAGYDRVYLHQVGLNVLVLMGGPAYSGTLVAVRLLGVIEAEQSDGNGEPYRNDRLIAVAEGSTERGDLRHLSDLDDGLLTQIEAFFETYEKLTGKSFPPLGRRGERVARRLLDEAISVRVSPH